MPPTLHVTDLDGTLLGPDRRMSARSAELLGGLLAEGLLLSYATARSFRSARVATEGVRFSAPVIVYGGAFLVDPASGGILESRLLDPGAARAVVEAARAHGLPPLVYRLDGDADRVLWVEGEESPGLASYLADRAPDPRFAPVAGWGELAAAPRPFYLSVIGDDGPVRGLAEELRAELGDRLAIVVQRDTYHPAETWLEVTAPRANKADAVASLRHRLGARRLVCFGDNENDRGMLESADEGYAVANAIPAIRELATGVIPSNAEDGVARWLAAQAQSGRPNAASAPSRRLSRESSSGTVRRTAVRTRSSSSEESTR